MFGDIPLCGGDEDKPEVPAQRGFTEQDQQDLADSASANALQKGQKRGLGFAASATGGGGEVDGGGGSSGATKKPRREAPPQAAPKLAPVPAPIMLAGRSFADPAELWAEVKALQERAAATRIISLPSDHALVMALLDAHPQAAMIRGAAGVGRVEYAAHARCPGAKALLVVRADDSVEILSARKVHARSPPVSSTAPSPASPSQPSIEISLPLVSSLLHSPLPCPLRSSLSVCFAFPLQPSPRSSLHPHPQPPIGILFRSTVCPAINLMDLWREWGIH